MWWGGGGSEEDDREIKTGDDDDSPPLEILADDDEIESTMANLSPRSTGSSPSMEVPRHRPPSKG